MTNKFGFGLRIPASMALVLWTRQMVRWVAVRWLVLLVVACLPVQSLERHEGAARRYLADQPLAGNIQHHESGAGQQASLHSWSQHTPAEEVKEKCTDSEANDTRTVEKGPTTTKTPLLQNGPRAEESKAETKKNRGGKETTNTDDILHSFLTSPTKGQHLTLVQKDSPYKITLDEDVTYRLRRNQEVHNTNLNQFQYSSYWGRPDSWGDSGSVKTNNATAAVVSSSSGPHSDDSNLEYVPLLLKSHPGQAIVTLSDSRDISGLMISRQTDFREIGIGDKNSAVEVLLLDLPDLGADLKEIFGRRFVLQTNDNAIFIVGSTIQEGAPVSLTSLSLPRTRDSRMLTRLQQRSSSYYEEERCFFVINADGTLSPILKPNLVIGISPVPSVTLVRRDSPNRFLFRFAERFWSAPAPVDGVPLELASHPGFAIVASGSDYHPVPFMTMQELGFGTIDNALRLYSIDSYEHHQFLLTTRSAGYDKLLVTREFYFQTGTPLLLLGYSTSTTDWWSVLLLMFTRFYLLNSQGHATWIINEEGSISPLLAPGLALGCDYAPNSRTHQIVSPEHRLMAQERATLPSRLSRNDEKEDSVVHIGFLDTLNAGLYIASTEKEKAQLACFFFLWVAIAIASLIPYQVWVTLLMGLCLGTEAALAFALVEITRKIVWLVAKFLYRLFRKELMQQLRT